jgi:hypothetical protein
LKIGGAYMRHRFSNTGGGDSNGIFTFTGSSTGNALANFLEGKLTNMSGVPGDFCTSVNETNWYERSLEWHEERSTHRSKS